MGRRYAFPLGLSLLVLILLTGCGDTNTSGDDEPTAVADSTNQISATEEPAITADPRSATNSTDEDLAERQTISTPFFATAPDDEPIVREEVTGPPPTRVTALLPTLPPGIDEDGDGFYSRDEMFQAITALYPDYEWPEDYVLELQVILDRGEGIWGPNDRFEAHGEYTIIGLPYQCAWQLTWLDAWRAGDEALMATSLEHLREELVRNPLVDPSTVNYLSEMYDLAELGDVAMLQQWADNNCDPTRFSTPVAGDGAVGRMPPGRVQSDIR